MGKGWLDNYNDSSVSVPEGFQGEGYSTKGRNYSPAWGGRFQTGGYVKKKVKKTEKELLKKYVEPSMTKALTKAKQEGITTGIHNGPLDAIRHSSSAAAMSSALPTWTNFIPGVAPLKVAATNIAGAAHEVNAPNDWKEHASDLYNNFIGSVVGVLPISEENQHDLLIQAQKHGVLSDMGNKTPLRKKQMGGSVYPVNYVPEAAMGASIPGAVGFSYARVAGSAPSNGPYAKKTKASAKDGEVIKDDLGQWAHPGEITEINSPYITMKNVPYPVLGISDAGDVQMMYPEEEYEFIGDKVTEFPMAKNGIRQEQKGLVNLDQLTNFTNYNTKQPGGWLDKY